ncbi:O-antigen ligase family protein, partial [Candidatus Pelagibacter sp.]|nr:O-antigen ligase family protein [Candidatus Pelagibacter sp.]
RNDINASENEIGLKRWPYYGMAAKSYTIFKKNIMFGSTYKSYRNECRNKKYYLDYSLLTNGLNYDGCSNHPHNIYLEILSEQGLVGLILLILTIYNFTLLKNLTLNNLNKSFYLVFLIVYFFPLRPFGSFYTNFGLVMFASVISFYLIFNKIEKKL